MLTNCASPNCCTASHSFSEGRLFQFEIVSISVSASDDTTAPFDEKPERRTAQFWLCGHCASHMTLMLEPVKGLRLVPLDLMDAASPGAGEPGCSDEELRHPHSC